MTRTANHTLSFCMRKERMGREGRGEGAIILKMSPIYHAARMFRFIRCRSNKENSKPYVFNVCRDR
jgi:hypothetical protein